jgi:RNA polymerase sigma factor (sigma-70 family)
VAQNEETMRERDESSPRSSRYPTSAGLVSAIHCGDEAAIRELYLLYAPLLRDQARRMGVAPGERAELVTTLLDDIVLHLMEHRTTPRHLTRYLVASLRNRARNWHRDSFRRSANRETAFTERTSMQRIVAECHSEYSLRASDSLLEEPVVSRASIAGLAAVCWRNLTREEIAILVSVGRHVPLREIANHLGISYVAARVRLHRLRERMRKLAIEYMRTLKSEDRGEMERFLRWSELGPRQMAQMKQEKANGKL